MRRVTVTLPDDVVDEIDRRATNRSRFLLDAARRELERHRRRELERSLRAPHADAARVAETGLDDWYAAAADGDDALVDPTAGRAVRWTPGEGWREEEG